MERSSILVCFALKQEAKGLLRSGEWKTLITGMGKKNAETSFRRALAATRPRLVITSGFGGGLNTALQKWKTIVYDEDARGDRFGSQTFEAPGCSWEIFLRGPGRSHRRREGAVVEGNRR